MRQLTNNLLVPVVMRFLIWQAEKRKRPFIGSINVVNRCNLHCAGCYWTRTEREQDRVEFLSRREWSSYIHYGKGAYGTFSLLAVNQ